MIPILLSDCESVFLLDLVTQILHECCPYTPTGNFIVPHSVVLNLSGVDYDVLASLDTKLSPSLV